MSPRIVDRVRGYLELHPDRIEADAANVNTHGAAQKAAAKTLLQRVGSLSGLVVWVPDDAARASLRALPGAAGFEAWAASFTGSVRLTDGHMRAGLFGRRPIRVQVTDIDAEEAALALLTFDPLGALRGRDAALGDALRLGVEGHATGDAALLAALLGERSDASPVGPPDRSSIVEILDAPDAHAFADVESPSVEDVLAGRARWAVARGDALALLQSLPDGSVDALITDPPYSSGGAFRGDRLDGTANKYVQTGTKAQRADFAGDTRDQRGFAYWVTLWLSEALRVVKPGSPVCIFADWRQLPTATDAIQAGGWVYRGIVPWDKTDSARPTLGRFASQCEYVIWGSAGPMPQDRAVGGGMKILHGLIRGRVASGEKFHQTGKPVEVMRQVNAITSPGGIILDPFFGSGSTGAAALLDGYRVIGCEKTDAYAPIARGRLAYVERTMGAP